MLKKYNQTSNYWYPGYSIGKDNRKSVFIKPPTLCWHKGYDEAGEGNTRVFHIPRLAKDTVVCLNRREPDICYIEINRGYKCPKHDTRNGFSGSNYK
jgi:hypothetical protein